jgi:hypothetical protein
MKIFEARHEIDLSEYSRIVADGGRLYWSPNGLAGSQGSMACEITGATAQIYGEYDIPPHNSNNFRLRFHWDPNSLSMASGDNFDFGVRLQASPGSRWLVFQWFRSSTGDRIRVWFRRDDGTSYGGSFVGISDEPHFIELRYQRSTSTWAIDGEIEVFIDGVSVIFFGNQDIFDDFQNINRVRLGVNGSVDAGTLGTFYLDEFTLRDDDIPIGPEIAEQEQHATTIFDYAGIKEVSSDMADRQYLLTAEQVAFLLATIENKSIFQGNWAVDGEQINNFQWDEISAFVSSTERALMIENEVGFFAYKTGNQPVDYNTLTQLTWEGVDFGDFDLTNNKFVAPFDCKLLLIVQIQINTLGSGTADRYIKIIIDQDGDTITEKITRSAGGNDFSADAQVLLSLSKNDEVEVWVIHNNVADDTVVGGGSNPSFVCGGTIF